MKTRALLAASVAALLAPLGAPAAPYGWPVEPFHRQHPVRGFFGDPRIGEDARGSVESKTFHFGVDISAPDGTPVYASMSGRIVWEPQRPETVAIRGVDGTVFAYWHIVPAVRNGDAALAYRTVLGRIARGWAHVHFAELRHGRYLNPLREGALTPYEDETRPTIQCFGFEREGSGLGRTRLSGRLDLVAEAWDETPVRVPGRWRDRPVMPALVRWRIVPRNESGSSPWRTAIDFSRTIPAPGLFDAVYARWTRQNHPWRNGRYRVLLSAGWDSGRLGNGRYRLEVEARDTRGNRAVRSTEFRVANPPAHR